MNNHSHYFDNSFRYLIIYTNLLYHFVLCTIQGIENVVQLHFIYSCLSTDTATYIHTFISACMHYLLVTVLVAT